ncbi:MAG: glycosyltransferase family 2 protein [Lapillicoccus sp.]
MRTAVVTLASGRHDHLLAQQQGLLAGTVMPDNYVVVAMDDPELAGSVATGPLALGRPAGTRVHVADVPLRDPVSGLEVSRHTAGAELPLAAARNLGARVATCAGASLLIMLDVDCIPGRRLVATYQRAARRLAAERGPTLLCGPVAYLPQPSPHRSTYDLDSLATLATANPARPVPAPGELVRTDDLRLFWSLSFAMTADDWDRVGGFDEVYVGYGGEDTDFGQRVETAGGAMYWTGGADAYHQHHASSDSPAQHLAAIVRNANLFHDRWGWFPMGGWLAEFAERGLAHEQADGRGWRTGPDPGMPG